MTRYILNSTGDLLRCDNCDSSEFVHMHNTKKTIEIVCKHCGHCEEYLKNSIAEH